GMALARPIVASAVGGIPEMLVDGQSGRLVPPDDPPALAAAVVELLADADARRRMGEAALARLTGTFPVDAFARTMFGAFDDAVHDSDDEALPGRLARPVAILEARRELGLVIMNGRFLPPEDGGGAEEPWVKPEVTQTLVGRAIGVAEVFRRNLGQLQGMCF